MIYIPFHYPLACRIWENGPTENSLEPHILDGIPVSDGFYPHMAAIAFNSFGTIAYRCGGSLISKRHVLTAAHCVNFETPTHVRLGTVDIEKVNTNFQDINISVSPARSAKSCIEINLFDLAEYINTQRLHIVSQVQ